MNIFMVYLLCCNMQATTYYVCHVDDTVRFAATKKIVKLHDPIQQSDSLLFTGAGARLVVISNKGCFYITNRKILPGQPLANVLIVVRDNILPGNKIAQMHTKASGALINLKAMQNHLASMSNQDRPTLLLVNNIRFYLNRQSFTDRDKNYFFLRYLYKGETIEQKLPYVEPQQSNSPLYVEINKNIFRKNNAMPDMADIKDMQLYYKFGDTPEPVFISDLAITMANREDLLNELKIVIRHQADTNGNPDERKEAVLELVAGYLQSNYGWTNKEELTVLFPELFK